MGRTGAVPLHGALATLMTTVVTIVILQPRNCLSFQPKVLPTSSVLLPHLFPNKSTTTTRLLSKKQKQFFEDRNDSRIGLLNLDQISFKSPIDDFFREVSSFAAISVLFFSIGATLIGPTLPAFADSTDTKSQEQQSLLLKEVSSEELALKNMQQPGQMSSSVIDEVWLLLDKYYIDRTFNSQDWKDVRKKVESQGEKVKFDDSKSMKIVTEMVQSLGDKYTRMLDKDQYAAIQKFDLIGVGVTLVPNTQKDIIVGSPPIAGSASDKAGLKVGDFVTAVNGRPTRGRNAFDIIDQIGENPNSKTVTFSILRDKSPSSLDSIGNPDASESFEVTMERQSMQIKDPVQYKISETRSDGTKVGYMRISEFNSLVNSSLQRALSELKKQGANAYVMDLRGNTGGAFQSAIEISGLFLQDRIATYVVDSNGVELPFRTPKLQDLSIEPEIPVVIWIDGMSASASEVLAGSLHDNCRAVTMGNDSFGKGLIQAVYGLKNGSGLVVTVAKYITPSGSEIQGKGITPDILPQGKNMPAPVFVPGLSTDTSKVDFKDVAERLSPKVCTVPDNRSATGGMAKTEGV
mmetsp:Transcript_23607/g.55934  ORF Transcript_23607/g.55934 Transcript_23607/m.55934 type:complete len:576 (+) Transcript_23607:145-1872(+)|eukprot:CAMPEP_0197184956 /NCGR_PEP_ID=MMETSP1423-20130617/10946_1 /TAXON_ID=476441 /ORGANISM="Pseudo-nitzschia heimii, Strain UNC1101" /LENGTH=575 /DNA_ID=CAMNT_0042635909 /DNA_START=83 /DNA_END=1810 /DNA_ORIENTATION=+